MDRLLLSATKYEVFPGINVTSTLLHRIQNVCREIRSTLNSYIYSRVDLVTVNHLISIRTLVFDSTSNLPSSPPCGGALAR